MHTLWVHLGARQISADKDRVTRLDPVGKWTAVQTGALNLGIILGIKTTLSRDVTESRGVHSQSKSNSPTEYEVLSIDKCCLSHGPGLLWGQRNRAVGSVVHGTFR